MNDDIGTRMKEQYEHRTRYLLPRRTYTIVRVDGKAFHGLTADMERPFDYQFMRAMNFTALGMVKEMQGARCAYVQSDEVSILLTDFDQPNTAAWFDGNLQKIVSVSSALATDRFKDAMNLRTGGLFDARAFTIPDRIEVANYFVWRQQDATRHSIRMAAGAKFSHAALHGKNTAEMQEMLVRDYGINWNDYPEGCKRGRVVLRRVKIPEAPCPTDTCVLGRDHAGFCAPEPRLEWVVDAPPIFTQQREYLMALIPEMPR